MRERVLAACLLALLCAPAVHAQIVQYRVMVESPITAGVAFPVMVQGVDAAGQNVDDSTTSVRLTGSTTAIVFDADGDNIFNLSDNAKVMTNGAFVMMARAAVAGTFTIAASDGTRTGLSNEFPVDDPEAVTRFAIDPIGPQVAGTPFPITLRALKANADPAASFQGTVDFLVDTGSMSPNVSGTFVNGVLTQNVTVHRAGTRRIQATITGGGATGLSDAFSVTPGAIDHFVFASVGVQTSGVSFNATITASDAHGNIATAFIGTVNLTTNGGSIVPATSGAFAGGIRNESITLTGASPSRTITASRTGGSESGTSNSFVVTGSVNHFVVSPIGPQVAGVSFPVTITARDSGGTIVPSFSGNVDLSVAGAVNIPLFSGPFSGGVRNEIVEVRTAGSRTLTATRTGGTETGSSNSFAVTAAALNHFRFGTPAGPFRAGQPFGVAVQAEDAYSNVVTGFNGKVGFAVDQGTIDPVLSGAFSGGARAENVTLTAAGNRTITATRSGGTESGVLLVTVSPATATTIAFAPIAAQVAGEPFDLTLTARDAQGNIDSQFNGTVTIAVDEGSVAPMTSATFVNGQLRQTVTVTKAGTRTITVTQSGGGAAGSSNGFAVTHSVLHHYTIGSIATQSAGQPFDIVVRAEDAHGNVVTSFASTVALSVDGGGITPASSGLFTAGIRTQSVTLTRAGTRTITVTNGPTASSNAFTLLPGPIHHVSFTTVGDQVAGTPFAVTLTAKDAQENTVSGFTGTVNLSTPGGTMTPLTTLPFIAGVVSQTVTIETAGSRVIQASGPASGGSNTFAVNPGPLQRFGIASVAPQTAGTPFLIQLTAQDAWGNTVPSFNGTVALAADAGPLTPSSSAAFSGGMLSQSVVLTATGSRTLVVTRTGGTERGTSNPFALAHAALHHFAFAPIGAQIAGQPFTITITAYDAYENIVTGFAGTVGLTTASAAVAPSVTSPFAAGTVTQKVSVGASGTHIITATRSGGTESGASNSFAVAAGNASATLSSVTANPAAVVADGTTEAIVKVTVRDASGNSLAGKSVLLARTGVSTVISANPAVTNASGVAQFSAVSTLSGSATFSATVRDDSVTIVQTATVTFVPGAASALRVVAPSEITAGVPAAFRLELVDAAGNIDTAQSGPREVTFSIDGKTGGWTPTARDMHRRSVPFADQATLMFTGGIAFTDVTLYRAGPAVLLARTAGVPPASVTIKRVGTASAEQFVFSGLPLSVHAGFPLGSGELRIADRFGNAVPNFDAGANPVLIQPCTVSVGPGRGCRFDRSDDFVAGVASLRAMTLGGLVGSYEFAAITSGISGRSPAVAIQAGSIRTFTPRAVCEDWDGDVTMTFDGVAFTDFSIVRASGSEFTPTVHSAVRMSVKLPFGVFRGSSPVAIAVMDRWGNRLLTEEVAKLPPLTAEATNDGPQCVGNNVQLTGRTNHSDATAQWSGPGGFAASGLVASLNSSTEAHSGTYTLTVARAFCHDARAYTPVTVVAPRDLTLTAPRHVYDLTTGLTASATAIAGATYEWSVTGGTITQGNGTPNIVWTSGGGERADLKVRVRIGGANGCSTETSKNVAIYICSGRTAPLLLAPTADAAAIGSPVRFAWSAVTGARSYTLTMIGDEGLRFEREVSDLTTELLVPLPSGRFRWAVTARFVCPELSVSELRTFVVAERACETAAPALVFPTNDTVVRDDYVVFRWTAVPGAIAYAVLMPYFGGELPVAVTAATEATVKVSQDFDQGTWRVRPLFSGCRGTASASGSFRRPSCRFAPVPLSVSGFKPTESVQKMTFRWSTVDGADNYRLRLFDSRGFPQTFQWGGFEFQGEALVGFRDQVEVSFKMWDTASVSWSIEALSPTCPAVRSKRVMAGVRRCDSSAAPATIQRPVSGQAFAAGDPVRFLWTTPDGATPADVLASRNGGPFEIVASTSAYEAIVTLPAGSYRFRIRLRGFTGTTGSCSTESAESTFSVAPCSTPYSPPRSPWSSQSRTSFYDRNISFYWYSEPRAASYLFRVSGFDQYGYDREFVRRTLTNADARSGFVSTDAYLPTPGYYWWTAQMRTTDGCEVETPQYHFENLKADCALTSKITVPKAITVPFPNPAAYTVSWSPSGVDGIYQLIEYEIPIEGCLYCGFRYKDTYVVQGTSKNFSYYYGTYAYFVRPLNCPSWVGAKPPQESETGGLDLETAMRMPVIAIEAPAALLEVTLRAEKARRKASYLMSGEIVEDVSDWFSGTFGLAREGGVSAAAAPTFEVKTSEPWLTVHPSSGTYVNGMAFTSTVNPALLGPGTHQAMIAVNRSDQPEPRSILYQLDLVVPVTEEPISPTLTSDVLVVPVAHASGASGHFRSDLTLTNVGTRAHSYAIAFHPTGVSAARAATVDLAAGGTVSFDDVLTSQFGVPETASVTGFLSIAQLRAPGAEPAGTLRATSRMSHTSEHATTSESIPALSLSDFAPSGRTITLAPVTENAAFRTNIGFIQWSGSTVPVVLEVFNSQGLRIGRIEESVPGGQLVQFDAILEKHGITVTNGRIEVSTTGLSTLAAYASVIDRRSNDALFVRGRHAAAELLVHAVVPGVASVAGWRSDLFLGNRGTEAVEAELRFHDGSSAGTRASRTLTIAPGESRILDDVLATVFGMPGSSGVLHIVTREAALTVSTRTHKLAVAGGSGGQFIEAVPYAEAVRANGTSLQILGGEESILSRTNVGIAEVSGEPVTVEIRDVAPDGTEAMHTFELRAHQFLQIPRLLEAGSFNHRLEVRVAAGKGAVVAYASVIDRQSGDPMYVRGQ